MRNRSAFNFKLVGLGVVVIVVIVLLFNVIKNVDKSEIVCCQHLTGKLVFWTTPGPKFQWFGTTTSYDRSVQVWFAEGQKGGRTINGPINIRFNDGGTARISGSVRVELPSNDEQLYKIVTKFSNMEKLMSDLIIPTVNKSVQASGPMMTAYESYAEKKNDLMRYIEDQISNGVYQTIIKEIRVQDEISGDEKVVRVAIPVQDSNAINGIKRQELPPFKEFGIKIVQVALNDISYDDVVINQISKQQQILMDMKTSYSAALKAKQDAIKAEEMGKAKAAEERWKQEAIKAVEVTKAQQAFEVAELNAKEAKEIAKKIIAEGEAQAAANRAKVSAGLTPQEKAEWDYKKTVGVAAELSKSQVKWVPEIMIIGGEKQQSSNPLDAVGLKMLLDISKTMNKE